MALLGVILILIQTSRFGAGLTYDSIRYISGARNIADGNGYFSYSGQPIALWPPLYSGILAMFYLAFGLDPLYSAIYLGALIFAVIIISTGLLAERLLEAGSIFAYGAILLVLLSFSLHEVSTMALTEA